MAAMIARFLPMSDEERAALDALRAADLAQLERHRGRRIAAEPDVLDRSPSIPGTTRRETQGSAQNHEPGCMCADSRYGIPALRALSARIERRVWLGRDGQLGHTAPRCVPSGTEGRSQRGGVSDITAAWRTAVSRPKPKSLSSSRSRTASSAGIGAGEAVRRARGRASSGRSVPATRARASFRLRWRAAQRRHRAERHQVAGRMVERLAGQGLRLRRCPPLRPRRG